MSSSATEPGKIILQTLSSYASGLRTHIGLTLHVNSTGISNRTMRALNIQMYTCVFRIETDAQLEEDANRLCDIQCLEVTTHVT